MHSFSSSGGRSIKIKLDIDGLMLVTLPYGQTKPKSTIIQRGNWRFKIKVNEKFKAIQLNPFNMDIENECIPMYRDLSREKVNLHK